MPQPMRGIFWFVFGVAVGLGSAGIYIGLAGQHAANPQTAQPPTTATQVKEDLVSKIKHLKAEKAKQDARDDAIKASLRGLGINCSSYLFPEQCRSSLLLISRDPDMVVQIHKLQDDGGAQITIVPPAVPADSSGGYLLYNGYINLLSSASKDELRKFLLGHP